MTTHARTFIGAGAGVAVGAILTLVAGPWALSAQDARQDGSSTVVACEPSERVVVRHTVVNNQLQVASECAPTGVSAVQYQNASLRQTEFRRRAPSKFRPATRSRLITTKFKKESEWALSRSSPSTSTSV